MNTNTKNFSALERGQHLQALSSQTFDVLVIGGGATGCGIALDAASRGLKTALVEKADFAAGTSSKSTKLIHGGLRYLKQFEVGLVRETGQERAIVHRLAPHLVLPEKMLLPIVKNGTYGKWAAAIGVLVYDLLAGVKRGDRRKMLSKAATLAEEPLLDEAVLLGSCLYAEYRTDDARLTIELIKRAVSFGATALNYCSVTGFIYDNGQVCGVHGLDHLSGETLSIKAKHIVSAGGPWVDELRALDHSKKGKQLRLTKGVHLVFPHEKLPLRHSVYFDVPDGRMVFAIPRGKTTYVGTTDTDYTGSLEHVVVTQADAEYLLAAVRHAFPALQLTAADIVSNWAGLRPLIHEEGKPPSAVSRKDEIFESPTGLLSIAGGKLTGYRKMAQRIVDLVCQRLGHRRLPCQTHKIPLVQDAFRNSQAVQAHILALSQQIAALGLGGYHSWYLTTTYGKQSALILDKFKDFNDPPETALARAELWFAVQYEMANSLSDFFVRRTGRLYFDIGSIAEVRAAVAQDMAGYLHWDEQRVRSENEGLDALLFDAGHYYEGEVL